MVKLAQYIYADNDIEYLEADEPNFNKLASEESCKLGVFLTDQELKHLCEKVAREAWGGGINCTESGGKCFNDWLQSEAFKKILEGYDS